MVQDLSYNLCESLVENIDGVAGIGKKTPTPIYLTQWKIVGNSEVHGQEIWSCGEYNATDGKYHILVQPLGGSIADIALDAPLRKVNDVADTIEFPSGTEDKALITRNIGTKDMGNMGWKQELMSNGNYRHIVLLESIKAPGSSGLVNVLCRIYNVVTYNKQMVYYADKTIMASSAYLSVYDVDYNQSGDNSAFKTHVTGIELIYELATPTTELIDAPQIEEAESYTCVISQGGRAVEWSSFSTD